MYVDGCTTLHSIQHKTFFMLRKNIQIHSTWLFDSMLGEALI